MTITDRPGADAQPRLPRPTPIHDIPFPRPPWLLQVSGLYTATGRPLPHWPLEPRPANSGAAGLSPVPGPGGGPVPGPVPEPRRPLPPGRQPPRLPHLPVREDLRLDVDGWYPQMLASGTLRQWLTGRVDWIAELTETGQDRWAGAITFKDGDLSLLPHAQVEIQVVRDWWSRERRATVMFSGGSAPRTREFEFRSPSFHDVELEFDCVQGTALTDSVETHAHPNHPASLPNETLAIADVFERAGFAVRTSGGDSVIPLSGAGSGGQWSDQEMHDAMVVHWSSFADAPQWALWTLFAGQHEQGSGLGGIMFDDIGPNHRQGTAVFIDSFISQPPDGESDPDAWIRRMRFWTAVHEMGHAFNLAHAWQKHLGNPWQPLTSDDEARSFMNYPFRVSGDETAFFSDFAYRFIDEELLFLRHAPERFVQQGNADWFDDHGFEQATVSVSPQLKLQVRTNREVDRFEFLEPVNLELKLTNVSQQPIIIDRAQLASSDALTVIVKRRGQAARSFQPFATYCLAPDPVALEPGSSVYEALFVSAGIGGWTIAEPGHYTVQVAVHRDGEDIISEPLAIRVTPPRGYDEEELAQELFSDEVGRVLAFDGTRQLDHARGVLSEAATRLPERSIARHARYALGAPLMRHTKQLAVVGGNDGGPPQLSFVVKEPEPKAALDDLDAALEGATDTAAATFGHIRYKQRVDRYTDALEAEGQTKRALTVAQQLSQTLRERGVLAPVVADVDARCARLRTAAKRSTRTGKGSRRPRRSTTSGDAAGRTSQTKSSAAVSRRTTRG